MGRDFCWNSLLVRVHLTNNFHEFPWGHTLQDVDASFGIEGSLNLHVACKSRQNNENDDADLGKLRADSNHRINTAHIRNPQVHEVTSGACFRKQ